MLGLAVKGRGFVLAAAKPGLIGIGLLLCIGIVLVATSAISRAREGALGAAEANLRRLTFVLSETIEHQIETVDVELSGIADSLAGITRLGAGDDGWLDTRLRQSLVDVPGALRAAVFDANGRMAASSWQTPPPSENVFDRPYFQRLRDHADAGLVIGDPAQSRVDGRWTFVLARRFQDGEGHFMGVIATAMNVDYLERLFAATVPEPGARVVLLRGDMVMLCRYPRAADLFGRSMAWTAINDGLFGAGREGGSGRYLGAVDPQPKVVAGRRLGHHFLAVSIAVPEQTVLESWRQLAWGIGCAAVLAVFAVMTLLTLLAWQIARLKSSEAALASTQVALAFERGRLTQVLDTTSDGFWEWHLDTGIVDWSERCCTLVGLPAAGGIFHIDYVLDMIHPEDRPHYLRAVRRLLETNRPFEMAARWQAPGGEVRWLCSRAGVVRDAAGRPVSLVGANTDALHGAG